MDLYTVDSFKPDETRPAPDSAPKPPSSAPLVPKSVVTLADMTGGTAGPAPAPRLDPAFFADRDAVLAMVARWTRDELYALGNVLMGEGDRRIEGQLLDVLRALCAQMRNETEPSVVRVEFVTDANYDDGVFWEDETIYLHRADGSVGLFDFEEDDGEDPEFTALDEGFRDLLADYSRTDHPQHGAHLIVDLTTGVFEVSGPHCLV